MPMEDSNLFGDNDTDDTVDDGGSGNGVQVEVVDDTPPADRGRKPLNREVADPSDEELAQYSEGVRKRISELTRARHDERRKAERLEREQAALEQTARALLEQNRTLQSRFHEGAKQFKETATAGANLELENARRALIEAQESFDPVKITEAQEKLFEVKNKVMRLAEVEVPPSPVEETVVQQRQVQARPQVDAATQEWLGRNRWFQAQGHEDMTSLAMGLHHKLVQSGVRPGTAEYFESIDSRMRKAFPEQFADDVDTPEVTTPKPRRQQTVAPGGRTPAQRVVRLTPSQLSIAKRLGLTPEQYAAELVQQAKL